MQYYNVRDRSGNSTFAPIVQLNVDEIHLSALKSPDALSRS